jgi:hypothetical protein
MPISRIMLDVLSVAGIRCEASADRPSAAPTADIASSTGTPAAISAPNTSSMITSVTGMLISSAFWKSSPRVFDSALSSDEPPTCSTRRSGNCFCTAAVVSSSRSTRSSAVSGSPAISTLTSTAVPFGDGTGSLTPPTSRSAPMSVRTSFAAAVARSVSSTPSRAEIRTFSVAGRVKPASSTMLW